MTQALSSSSRFITVELRAPSKNIVGGCDFIKDRDFVLEYFSYQLKVLELPVDSYLCPMDENKTAHGAYPNTSLSSAN
jgi:hypothetical protein